MDAEKIKAMIDQQMKGMGDINFEELLKNAAAMQQQILPKIEAINAEYNKLAQPKSLKNIIFYNKEVKASLISDGRVVLTFSNIEDSENYFKSLKSESKGFFNNLLKKCRFI